jgi:hypothetical protein
MPRKCSSGIIQEICKFYEGTEVPDAFALWSAIFVVNACLKRDCFIDQGHFTVYPNLYINLTAGSGVCRKSTAAYIAVDMLREVNPEINILSQRITPQELIGTLAMKAVKDKTTLVDEAVGCFIADELSTLIDKSNEMKVLIPILTKLYDCKDFDYSTRKYGKELVKNPCLSILGGSTLEWIKEAFPAHAIGGGFTARFIFPYRESKDRRIAWPRRSVEDSERFKRIAHDLNQISGMRGSMGLDDETIALYSDEYNTFLDGELAQHSLTSRYAARRHIHLLKVSMALSASSRDTREITKEDMWKSIKIIQASEARRNSIMRKIISEPVGDICEHVMALIMGSKEVSRADLIYETRHRITHKELDVILEGLCASGHVKCGPKGGRKVYWYVQKNQQLFQKVK